MRMSHLLMMAAAMGTMEPPSMPARKSRVIEAQTPEYKANAERLRAERLERKRAAFLKRNGWSEVSLDIEPYIRPSSTGENALCPGRPRMQAHIVEQIGKRQEAAEANLGHRAHAWGEAGVRFLARDMCTFELREQIASADDAIADIRRAHEVEDPDQQLDSWTLRVVEDYIRFVHGLIVKHDIAPADVLVEERLDMTDIGFTRGGTSDCILVKPFKRLIVIDLKAGFLEQEDATEHSQIAGYGVAGALRFKVDDVEVWIAQPRQDRAVRFTGATFDAEKIRSTAAWIIAVNNRCRAERPELAAKYTQCVNCQALVRCPAARKYIMDAMEALETLGAPLDGYNMADLIDAAKLAEKFAEAGKDLGKAFLQSGQLVPGWRLGNPRAIRSVRDPATALTALEEAGISAVSLALVDALTFKVGKIPPAAAEIIGGHIVENLSSPPLTADRSTAIKGAA